LSLYLISFPTRRSSDLLLDFGNLVHDLLLIDDKGTADTADDAGRLLAKVTGIDPNNFVAAFGTAQELGARLNALGILTLQGGKLDRKSTRLNSSHVAIS